MKSLRDQYPTIDLGYAHSEADKAPVPPVQRVVRPRGMTANDRIRASAAFDGFRAAHGGQVPDSPEQVLAWLAGEEKV